MSEALIIVLLFTLVLVVLSRALMTSKRQARVMKMQGLEIKKQMLELERQNQELQKLNKEKLQIISLVSHDLKGPFNRIFALIHLIGLAKENLTEEQLDYLDKIHHVSVDGLGMVRNLLDSRRLEDQEVELNTIELDLSKLVSSLVKTYSSVAEKKKIEMVLDIAEPIMIKADKLYISRVIENLFSNAIKFSPERKKVFIKLIKLLDTVELSVKDQGPGISKEDQLKLYQRFQHLSARPTGGESSTGLGLFIIKTILDKMEAEILCESELDQGTCFIVRLPKKILAR